MSSGSGGLRKRWDGLPRAAKWGLMAAVGIGVYFLGVEPLLQEYERAVARGSADEAQLERLQAREMRLEEAQTQIALGVTRFGDASLRTAIEPGPVYDRLDAIFAEHGVRGYTIDSPRREQLEREVKSDFEEIDPNVDPQRQVFTVRFTAEPEEVISVLADLERAPEITTISSVNLRRLDREDERLVEAVLTPEVWYVARKVENR